MNPTTVARLPLHQIATQQQDAIVFDVSSIATVGTDAPFLIFYLSKDDEFNGYGTVIQLDQQTKQAAIYADLNPEYTYLFYQNEQNQLQTLLWCIEVATQTSDGLFIAHAKSYGRGISTEDLKRFNQVDLPEDQPQAEHQLNESYTTSPTPSAPMQSAAANSGISAAATNTPIAQPTQQPQSVAQNQAASNVQTSSINTAAPQPAPLSAPIQAAPVSTNYNSTPNSTPNQILAPTSVSSPTPASSEPTPTQPQSVTAPAVQPARPTQTAQPGFSPAPSQPIASMQSSTMPKPAPLTSLSNQLSTDQPFSFADNPTEASTMPSEMELNLPPLPRIQPDPSPTPPPLASVADILQPVMPPSMDSAPTMSRPQAQTQAAPTPKQPVGRPPKPLMQDQLWSVAPDDFTWIKNMSRSPIAEFRDVLHQKAVQQIRANRPGLMEDWQFTGMFEQAFTAVCTTYELIPALRHDILKALLNGRIVDNIQKSSANR